MVEIKGSKSIASTVRTNCSNIFFSAFSQRPQAHMLWGITTQKEKGATGSGAELIIKISTPVLFFSGKSPIIQPSNAWLAVTTKMDQLVKHHLQLARNKSL